MVLANQQERAPLAASRSLEGLTNTWSRDDQILPISSFGSWSSVVQVCQASCGSASAAGAYEVNPNNINAVMKDKKKTKRGWMSVSSWWHLVLLSIQVS
jgi:hypothetical protein